MIPDPVEIWERLGRLPPAVAIPAVLVAILAVTVIVVVPLLLLLHVKWRDRSRRRDRPYPGRGVQTAARCLDTVNLVVGRAVCWIALPMVLMQFAVVVLRYVFSIGSIPMQESIWYLHALLFMLGAGYTLLEDRHVRIDIWYRGASPRARALVDLAGSVLLLIPLCAATIWLGWDYVAKAWTVKEASVESGGLPWVYLLKTVIPVSAGLLFVQAMSLALRNGLVLTDRLRISGDSSDDVERRQ